jgi:hypothetical protein
MGMEQTVTFEAGRVPTWEALRDLLAAQGFPVQLRMIDGELAFPDELPPAEWRELRLGTPQGMITLRRQADRVTTITWGNAEPSLRQAWNAVTWACAEVASGQVLSETGPLSPADYRSSADLPAVLGAG